MQSSQTQSSISRTLAVLGLVAALAVTVMVVVSTGIFTTAGGAADGTGEAGGPAGATVATTGAVTTAGGSYTVQSGDTLDDIARKHETTIEVLVNLNPGISDPYNLMPGTRLAVP